MSQNKAKLMIIDGNALIHRSFHALPPLTTKAGEMVNAVYGFITILFKAIREFKPAYIVLTLDRKEKTFRHEEYKEYKATRVKAPQELYDQILRIKEVAKALNIPIFELAGFEADDLIGTIATETDGSIEKIIVTGDMDTLQLINDHTKVFTMRRGLTDSALYDATAVKERYGLIPEQMIDYKALRGDPSDNIPGVKGIGEKTAVELLQKFKTLDGVYEYVEKDKSKKEIKERIIGLLELHKNNAYMSQSLATIRKDAKIKFVLEDAKFVGINHDQATALLTELEFNSLLPRLRELEDSIGSKTKTATTIVADDTDKYARNLKNFKYQLVDNDAQFNKFFSLLKKQKEFVIDTETSGLDIINAELLGISFSWHPGEAYYVNVKSQKSKVKSQNLFNYNQKTTDNDWLLKLKPILTDAKIKKYGHNIKFDIGVLAAQGIELTGVAADSMIASYLLNPGTRQHNLDALTLTELGHQKITKVDLLGQGKDKIGFVDVPLEKLYNYSCEDADFTWQLIKKLWPRLKKEGLEKLFTEMEMPLVPVLATMEKNGIKINIEYLKKMSIKIHARIKKLEAEIYKIAGNEFNVNSTQQLREILFTRLNLPTKGIGKTKTGLSTGADELEKLTAYHPIIALIQEHRELMKLLNTYIDALPELVNKKTGRVHTSYNQAITATGRLSSTEPNLQNIPIRTELGREMRAAFVADRGCCLVSLDYSQIELRLAAHMSGDPKMIAAFKKGADIHAATAAEINNVALNKVTPEMRREAKAINFGILYGQGPHGLSQSAGIPYVRAQEFIDNYFHVYRGVKKFLEKTLAHAHADGLVETLFGRKRFLPEINSTMVMVKKSAERMAINTPIQGTAADMIKLAMIKVSEHIKNKYHNQEVKMLLQVHDELLFEIQEKYVTEATTAFTKIMENVIKLKVPIIVDTKVGENWGEMKTIKN